jgi:hypothetical protein
LDTFSRMSGVFLGEGEGVASMMKSKN